MPKISVVIPTYNAAVFLNRAVQSVNAQTYRDFEIIIADDGSDDETAAAVERVSNCRYFKIPHSGLPAAARNFGVQQAQSEYIAFLDSDDVWLPDKLRVQSQILDVDSEIGLVCSNALVTTNNNPCSGEVYLKPGQGKTGKVLKELVKDNFIITSTVLMRRDLFRSAGGFSEEPWLRALEDYDLWLRVAASSAIHYVEEPLAFYRYSSASLSRSAHESHHWRAMADIFDRCLRNTNVRIEDGLAQTIEQSMAMSRCSECDVYLNDQDYSALLTAWLNFLGKQPMRALKYMAVKLAGRR